MNSFLKALRAVFSLDTRSLSLFRIGLGFVLLGDALTRMGMLREHYTDVGMLPRLDLVMTNWQENNFSLLMLNGSEWFVWSFFGLLVLACLMLILGIWPRMAIFVCWACLLSIAFRNPFTNNSGDFMMLIFLVWSFFLPLNEHFSWRPSRHKSHQNTHFSGMSILYVLQIAIIYFASALLKSGGQWEDGTAVAYALQMTYYTSGAGHWLLGFPNLLKGLTYSTYYLELAVILLLFLPFFTSFWRFIVYISFSALHLGFIVFLNIGAFPWFCLAFWLAMLPSGLWDALNIARARAEDDELSVGILRQLFSYSQHVVGVLMAAGILYLNFGRVQWENLPPSLVQAIHLLKMNQSWGMFAPNAAVVASWLSAKAETEKGQFIDILAKGKPYQSQKFDHQLLNARHRKYLVSLMDKKLQFIAEPFATYVFKDWNERNPRQRIKNMRLYINVQALSVQPNSKNVVSNSLLYEFFP